MWTIWQLVFGPGTERNTFGLIAPLTAWAVVTAFVQGRGRTYILTTFLLMTVVARGQVERALVDVFPAILAAHPLGVLLFAGWLIWHAAGWESRDADVLPAIDYSAAA
jgi:hypothetical protein